MARKVFFSFKYDDVQRAMNVRNSNVIATDTKYGFIDKADFEEVQRKGDAAIKAWIDGQLSGTTVTVVLVGANTDKSKWVKYEIAQSIARGNGILTIDISKIANLKGETTDCCSLRVQGYNHYLWNNGHGRDNLGAWVEDAAKAAGKP
ncbi:TIR domain-containing protein [Pseudomonas alliivorans]|uniref:TIR domain-containing protein n=1 Tax=Pseudomonas viridiflava TaxID=33069 RepID=UPI001C31C585|nr:TIR domain-containing protein [Pseudomonas viridiflava]MEE4668085.1 TIR domain-containing protein [Pseudomonas alliivorans]MEE4787929.1 TIR domain-containing protein [Pseudomonas alliivorans]MEE4793205.1 TIR domain-containing protein [Pseudomonas alliivorans]MEE4799438.1 TIR domain-containing protein [Pseudomonas alliivorans]MEE4809214.1 TIR domain-containing protein [Pseudomonas alliivorans]